jgi:Zinc finger, ZZ type
MQCADFDLCMKCEQQMVHRHHLMIRISNENMKNLPARQNCKINLRQFAPRMATETADVEMGTPGEATPADDKQKKGDRHRKG